MTIFRFLSTVSVIVMVILIVMAILIVIVIVIVFVFLLMEEGSGVVGNVVGIDVGFRLG